jgi:uncharacterized protein YbjT (DUF2867 family)
MVEYDGSKCQPHGQTRCILCMAASKRKGETVVKAAPPEITGAPPADIEGLGNVRDRVVEEAQAEFMTDYDKIIAEMNQRPADQKPAEIVQAQPGLVDPFQRDTFSTLPTDDSHASKVLRAAAKFASTAQSWAQELAYVEKCRKIVLEAEAELSKATKDKEDAERELKELVTGE